VQTDDRLDLRPVGLAEGLDVRVLAPDAVQLTDADHLLGRRQERLAGSADVTRVDALVGRQARGQRFNLLGRSEDAGRVEEATGQAECPLLQRSVEARPHRCLLVGVELPPLEANLLDAQRTVGHERHNVHRYAVLIEE
jgi:hypothetical protein